MGNTRNWPTRWLDGSRCPVLSWWQPGVWLAELLQAGVERLDLGFEKAILAGQASSEAFESKVRAWPNVALATPVRNSALQDEMHAPGCHFVGASDFSFDKTATEAQKAKAVADIDDKLSRVAGNALLYLGSATGLTQSPIAPDLYLDMDFRKEIGRRFQIITGGPMIWPSAAANPMSPRYVRSYGGVSKEAK